MTHKIPAPLQAGYLTMTTRTGDAAQMHSLLFPVFCGLAFYQQTLYLLLIDIEALQNMLNQGQDNLLLRYGLAQALLKDGQPDQAIEHLLKALEFEPQHSAAYKLLGKAYSECQQTGQAISTYEKVLNDKADDIESLKRLNELRGLAAEKPNEGGKEEDDLYTRTEKLIRILEEWLPKIKEIKYA